MQNLLFVLISILAIGFVWVMITSSKRQSIIKGLNGKVSDLNEKINKLHQELDISSEEFKNVRLRNGQITIKYKSQIEQLNARISELENA